MKSLKELLQQVRASKFSNDGRVEVPAAIGGDPLARLPIELHIMLLEYLCADDVVAALNASKTWRIVWLSDVVWPWLADRWYPDLSEAIRQEAVQPGATFRHLYPLLSQKNSRLKFGKSIQNDTIILQHAMGANELFRQMLGRLQRRNRGKYGSALYHQMQLTKDSIFSLPKHAPLDQGFITSIGDLEEDMLEDTKLNVSRFMVYNNGRIAWWPNSYSAPYIAVVDDLRTAGRRIYRFPDHAGIQKGYKTAMSSELLVIARDRAIYAWHLEKNVLDSFVVPEEFQRCVAEGSKVLIITNTAVLYIWRFGGPLQPMSTSTLGLYQPGPSRMGGLVEVPLESHSPMLHITRRQGLSLNNTGMFLDFILHPSAGNVVFVVTMHQGDLIVHEIEAAKLISSYSFHADMKTTVGQWQGIEEYLRWEKCNSYGGYCLFSTYLGVDNGLSPSSLQSPDKPFCTCGQQMGLVSVCFNIYTKAFQVKCHHFLPSGGLHTHLKPAAFHLWQNKLYMSYAPQAMRAGMPITALRSCLAVQNGKQNTNDSKVPIYTMSEKTQGLLTRRKMTSHEDLSDLPESLAQWETWRRQVDFGLDITALCASESVRSRVQMLWNWGSPNIHQRQTIVGDDDFLLYVVDGAYTIWSFLDEIAMPKEVFRWASWSKA